MDPGTLSAIQGFVGPVIQHALAAAQSVARWAPAVPS